jgi:predicted MFS family arabinose efflux permease
MIIFVAASTACAAAPTLPVLIAARIVQGTVKDQAHNVSLC